MGLKFDTPPKNCSTTILNYICVMKLLHYISILLVGVTLITSCKKDDPEPDDTTTPTGPNLVFKFKFDPNQERLDNFGQPSTVPSGHAAQSPRFNSISAHYIEMISSPWTALGNGEVVYEGKKTTAGGDEAIDFREANIVAEDEVFFSIPLSQVSAGTYEYIRVSLSYQNYDIDFKAYGYSLTGTLASFIGYNNYIDNYVVKNQTVTVNDDKLQGYWAFETVNPTATLNQGQVPAGAVTVPNPLNASSPIPAGSCLVTGDFQNALTITGNETEDVVVILSVSTNNSFEWNDQDSNGTYDPVDGDVPVDMGVRGLIGVVQ